MLLHLNPHLRKPDPILNRSVDHPAVRLLGPEVCNTNFTTQRNDQVGTSTKMMELMSTTEQCICLESWPHKLICNSQLKHVFACWHHVMEVYVSNVPWKNFHQLHISLLWKRAWFWLAQLSWFFLSCKHASVTTWKYPITRDTITQWEYSPP